MIKYIQDSNICSIKSGVILHGCNAQGVMNSGVAKQLRALYPQIYFDYLQVINTNNELQIPSLGHSSTTRVSPTLIIISGITQEFYGRDGRQYVDYDAMETVFINAASDASHYGLQLHVPYMIGAGLGGGNLETITHTLEAVSDHIGIDINCHVYNK